MRVLAFSLFSVLLAFASACANGGSGASTPGDDGGPLDEGGDATLKGDGPHPGGDGGSEGGAGTPAQKACDDNAVAYCTQLQMCAPFLMTIEYGSDDLMTCEAEVVPGCLDALAAPGSGWTGDALEACVSARTALTCSAFLYGKPQPSACRITGQIATSEACLYDGQCGTGYCRVPTGASCGNCVTLGATGAPCTSPYDCDGNLMCAGSAGSETCQPPSSATGPCSTTQPCALGLSCIGGTCTAPGGVGATCAAKNNGADCDYNQGAYCDTTAGMCAAYTTAQPGDSCNGATHTICAADATCYQSLCVAPAQDGSTCNAASGLNCQPPDTCSAADGGTCALFSAKQCK
jgi:hypothetical protein